MRIVTDNTEELSRQADALLDANRILEAQTLYKRITELNPGQADAWFMLGVIHGDTGQLDAGIHCLQRALTLDPKAPETHLNLGNLLFKGSQIEAAIRQLHQAVALDPEYPEAWMLLGNIYGQIGDYANAARCFQKTVDLWPKSPEARMNLASALRGSGQVDAAVAQLGTLLREHPDNPEALSNLADTLQSMRRHTDAEAVYRRLASAVPRDIRGHNGLAEALMSQGRIQEAEAACRNALELESDNFQAHANLGTILQVKGLLGNARTHLERAVRLAPDNAAVQYKLASILLALGYPDQAGIHCRRAVELNPEFVEAQSALASIYEHQGDHDRAWSILKPLVDRGHRSPHVLTAYAGLAHRYDELPRAIELIETLVDSAPMATVTRSQVCHQLGDLYERAGDYDRAFLQHQRSNQLKENRFDPADHANRISRTLAICDRHLLSKGPRASNASDLPVFILGMPRSGTSLVEQILASHPQVHGAGELRDIIQISAGLGARIRSGARYPECLRELTPALLDDIAGRYLEGMRATDAAALRITDKMPHNFLHLGLIQLLFPGARVIHTARNPLDTCVSIYFQEFSSDHAYAYDLDHVAAYYRQYEHIMQHWEQVIDLPILKVQYEDLVTDQETESRRMIEFLGLQWDDRCLKFFENKRHVATPSYDQVRQPMYTRSVERWRRYDRHLGRLKAELGVNG